MSRAHESELLICSAVCLNSIHVRRTDKVGSEAAYHDISEYMKHVEEYYIVYQYQNPNLSFKKSVYLATDEPSVFKDARAK